MTHFINEVKRKLTVDQTSEENTKKLRGAYDQSITYIENFPDEILYEIFDHLDGCEIYDAFSNLNHRFEQLLHSSSLLYKLKFDHLESEETYVNNYKQFFLRHRHQIFSINLSSKSQDDYFLTWFIFNSSLSRLESIFIHVDNFQRDTLIILLATFASLPRLFALTIRCYNDKNLNDIYRLIFALPTLKYNKLTLLGNQQPISLPIVINQQFSTIESLIIDHPFNFNEFASLISYTPRLRCLSSYINEKKRPSIRTMLPMTLSNLTRLLLYLSATFDETELFMRKLNVKLKFLSIEHVSENIAFIDAHRWEQIILQCFPDLEEFYFNYFDKVNEDHQYPIYSGELNQFSSSFWIERKWVFNIELTSENIIYSISPYKKRWYEYPKDISVNSPIEISKTTTLTITSVNFDEEISVYIKRVLTIAQIYQLEISVYEFFIDTLIQLIDLLPDLTTLKINSLTYYKPGNIHAENSAILYSEKEVYNITRVYVEDIEEIPDLYFLLELCPCIEHLELDYIAEMNITSFLRIILERSKREYNEHLRSLCLYAPGADNDTITNLETMISDLILSVDYKIERILEYIYFQWN